jgi:kynureninase
MIEIGKILPDFRAPDALRLGFAPLYTSHLEVHTAVHRIRSIVGAGLYEGFGDTKLTVT